MPTNRLGLVQVYTGNGKGKTSIALGIALRAIGQNLKVYIVQFLKGGAYTGEFIAATNFLPQIRIKQFGKQCIKEKKQLKLEGANGFPHLNYVREDVECGECRECFLNDNEQKMLAIEAFEHAKGVVNSGDYDLVVLDEINNCMDKTLVNVDAVLELIKNKPANVELVLTGRNAPKEIIDAADLVTSMDEVKHPMQKGVLGRRGVEY